MLLTAQNIVIVIVLNSQYPFYFLLFTFSGTVNSFFDFQAFSRNHFPLAQGNSFSISYSKICPTKFSKSAWEYLSFAFSFKDSFYQVKNSSVSSFFLLAL